MSTQFERENTSNSQVFDDKTLAATAEATTASAARDRNYFNSSDDENIDRFDDDGPIWFGRNLNSQRGGASTTAPLPSSTSTSSSSSSSSRSRSANNRVVGIYLHTALPLPLPLLIDPKSQDLQHPDLSDTTSSITPSLRFSRPDVNLKQPSSEQFAPAHLPTPSNSLNSHSNLEPNLNPLLNPGAITNSTANTNSTPSTNADNQQDRSNYESILKFPIESSHSYSYAHLSPNSLALRLNVLRRCLEILKDRPDLFRSIAGGSSNDANEEEIDNDNTNNYYNHAQDDHVHGDANNDNTSYQRFKFEAQTPHSTTLGIKPKNKVFTQLQNLSTDSILDTSSSSLSPTTSASLTEKTSKKYRLQNNASSAALAALFRPPLPRSDSLPIDTTRSGLRKVSAPSNLEQSSTATTNINTVTNQKYDEDNLSTNDGFKDVLNLLEKDMDSVMNNYEIASTLHDLSLSSQDEQHKIKHDMVKKKLIYALAMPFLETSVQTSSLLESEDGSALKRAAIRPSTTALNLLNNNLHSKALPLGVLAALAALAALAPMTPLTPLAPLTAAGPLTPVTPTLALHPMHPLSNEQSNEHPGRTSHNGGNTKKRPFQSMLTSKYSAPQSVFTIEADLPWSVKAANDLACLMFGISKTTIKALTLMDLIAPQFRDFVMSRLTKTAFENRRGDHNLFAGEIVAIIRPGDQNFSYTSLWAKKKRNLIIFMFDQVPCDAFDAVILRQDDDENNNNNNNKREHIYEDIFTIQSVHEVAGNLVRDHDLTTNLKTLRELSESLDSELTEYSKTLPKDEDKSRAQSHFINRTRYFTLQLEEGNQSIPCAITSSSIPLNDNKSAIKLKIHTMPYVAGIFVLNARTFQILSCNNAIARNLFGRSSEELQDQCINEIIPNFIDILHVGLETNTETFQLTTGLVLPEHFFRKYDALIKYQQLTDLTETEEDIFFKSHGVEGKHRDGKTIFVDVQARTSDEDALILWVTYSRTGRARSMSKELDKLSSSTSSISLASSDKSAGATTSSTRTKSHSSHARLSDLVLTPNQAQTQTPKHEKTGTNDSLSSIGGPLPSQLKLFDNEKEKELLEFSPREVTRALSTRRVDTVNILPRASLDSFMFHDQIEDQKKTQQQQQQQQKKKKKALFEGEKNPNKIEEGVELNRWNDVNEQENDGNIKERKQIEEDENEVGGQAGEEEEEEEDEGMVQELTPHEVMAHQNSFKATYSEEEILQMENEFLAGIRSKSSQWPQDVGLARRTKKFSEFKVVKEMGEGAYGKVVLAQHKEDPIYKIIIKCIDKERILVDTWVRDRKLGTIPSEIQIMAFLNSEPHPNIMRIVDFFEDLKYYYLETPIFGDPPAIDLFDYIEVKKDLTETDCKFIFKQVVSSIYHLHKQGIVHRDIKDENVIVDEKGLIKLIDFGSAGYVKQGPFDVFVGTIDYASPEVLRGEKYEGKPQDIWALGILLYTMLYKENPFYNVDEIMEGDLRIPYVVSETSLALIKKILVRDVAKRPTITDIVESDWLQSE